MAIFMMGYAVFILLLYIRSTTLPASERRDAEEKLVQSLEKSEEDLHGLAVKVMMLSAIIISIFYSAFYIIAAIQLDEMWFTWVSAFLVVLVARDISKIRHIIKTREFNKTNGLKFISCFGVFYTSYFIGQLYRMYDDTQSTAMIVAGIISVFVFWLFKALGKKQNANNKKRL
ncbi:hypothetical protein D3C81_198740 [compost metagenome]